jgi:hypothetical protein
VRKGAHFMTARKQRETVERVREKIKPSNASC